VQPAGDAAVELPRVLDEPGGHRLTVRRATAADEAALEALYRRLPSEDRRNRFFTGGCPKDDWVRCWLQPPNQVVVAVDEEGQIVADAGFALDGRGRAELGMVVERSRRGWLGPYLLDVVLRIAAEQGHDAIVAEVLATNRSMLALVGARGYALLPSSDVGTVRLVLGTHDTVPGWPGRHDRRRILVETPGGRSAAVAALADAGFDVIACPGPTRRSRRWHCPVLEGRPCPLVDDADAVVANLRADRLEDAAVTAGLPRVHPGVQRITAGPDVVAEAEHATHAPNGEEGNQP
jgi:hypothetical protein